MEYRSKTIGFTPNSVFVIAKDDNARFFPKGKEIFVVVDGKDGHGNDGVRSTFFMKCSILH